MHAQELEQPLRPGALPVEHAAGEVAVHELDAASDRARLLHAGEAARERAEVDLERPAPRLVGAVDDPLLDAKVLRDRHLARERVLDLELEVAPRRDARADREVQERRLDDGLLHAAQHRGERRRAQLLAVGRRGELVERLDELGAEQQRLAEAEVAPREQVDRLAVLLDQLGDRFRHEDATSSEKSSAIPGASSSAGMRTSSKNE